MSLFSDGGVKTGGVNSIIGDKRGSAVRSNAPTRTERGAFGRSDRRSLNSFFFSFSNVSSLLPAGGVQVSQPAQVGEACPATPAVNVPLAGWSLN